MILMMSSHKVILASGSPRRINMLNSAGVDTQVVIPQVDEELSMDLPPHQAVMCAALRKALSVREDDISGTIVSADTIVFLEGRMLGKPKNREDAVSMLMRMSGKTHSVFTGVCIASATDKKIKLFYERTDVTFKAYGKDVARAYVATGEADDKAGAYGIQGGFASQIEKVDGDYDNVVGLPLKLLLAELEAFE